MTTQDNDKLTPQALIIGNFYLKEEIDANFAKSGTSYEVPASSITIAAATGLTITKGYCKLEVINNVMYLVAQFSLKNDTASSISVANTCSLTFPVSDTEIAGKVFDVANHDLNYDSGDSNLTGILGTRYAHDSGIAGGGFSGGGNLNVCRRNNTAKQILAVLRDGPTIAANATYWFSFRTFLTLI